MAKYIRRKEIQEEIVEAYVSMVPASVTHVVNDRKVAEQVNIGDWIITHADGSQDKCTPEEFKKIYIPIII